MKFLNSNNFFSKIELVFFQLLLYFLQAEVKSIFDNELKNYEKFFYYWICFYVTNQPEKTIIKCTNISIQFFLSFLKDLKEIRDKSMLDLSKEEGFNLQLLEAFKYFSIKIGKNFFDLMKCDENDLENNLKAALYYCKGLFSLIMSNVEEAIQNFKESMKIKKVKKIFSFFSCEI